MRRMRLNIRKLLGVLVKKLGFGYLFLACFVTQSGFAIDNPLPTNAESVKLKLKQDTGAASRLKSWKMFLKDKKPRPVATLLKEVNDFFNQLQYVPETSLQGGADIWLTPYEFIAEGAGDCEDFAIAKYFTLVAMGVAEKKLRITYVSIPSQNKAHMVLTYYPRPDAEPFILDNLTRTILPASQRPELVPVYSFNGGEVWLNERIGKSRPYGKPSELSKWRSLLERIKLEEEH